MPLTADQYQSLIVTEVNDVGDLVANNIDTLWALYDTQTDLYIRYLYAKRKSIDLLMGSVREQVDRAGIGDITIKLSDKFKALQAMYQAVDAEILAVDSGQAAVAQLATPYTGPTSPNYPTAADRWRVDIANWRP